MDERADTGIDDQPPASAADALAIIRREQARQAPVVGQFYLLWGVAWLLIGATWFGARRELWSQGGAGIATLVLVLAGCTASTVLGIRAGRGVEGPSSRFGAMYGFGCFAAIVGTAAIAAALVAATGPAGAHFIPALFVFVVGVMYTVTGAFYRCTPDYVTGLVVQAVAVATAFSPAPWNVLVMGIGGGGTLIVAGIWRGVRR